MTRYPTSKRIKNAITWKPLLSRESTFLIKLDLSEAVTVVKTPQIPVPAALSLIYLELYSKIKLNLEYSKTCSNFEIFFANP